MERGRIVNYLDATPSLAFTAIVTQPAIASDDAGLPLVEAEQRSMGLDKPSELYVDGAYISAERLAQAQNEQREQIGPAQPAPRKEERFCVEDFQIDVEARKAICPSGKENTQCSRLEEESTGKVTFRFEWSHQCHDCPLRQQCLGKDQRHRTLVVGEHHTLLQARRREQQTEAFKLRARRRNAIEGAQSELVRGHGLRHARYRGLSKVRLQKYFIGPACNIKRWFRREQWLLRQIAQSLANNPATAAA
jgi:transposase